MAFYDLSKEERARVVSEISSNILSDLKAGRSKNILACFDDSDTYIRKSAYLSVGRIYIQHPALRSKIIEALNDLQKRESYRIRQSVINAAGEIGKKDFAAVQRFFDEGLFDPHHSPRNAVIGSIKKMAEVNPKPVLKWAKRYLHHTNKEIRREICHGIELRGRRHPQDILPLLQELQHDQTARVRNTLVHVLGQIAYKEGCLKTVVAHLKNWENGQLVANALTEIIDVHHRYRNFSALTQAEARQYIEDYFR